MEELYHYTSFCKAYKILKSGTFKFGQIRDTNDPFEDLNHRYSIIQEYPADIKQLLYRLERYVNEEISFASFGVPDGIVPPDQKWTMWAHYADKHSGVCLVFDKSKLINEVKILSNTTLYKEIDYKGSMWVHPSCFEKYLTKSEQEILQAFQDPLLFTKHIDWQCENEFRIIVFQKKFEIKINNCLTRIIYGPDTCPKRQKRIETYLKRKKLKVLDGKLIYADTSYAKPLKFLFTENK
ncbi:MAG: DUF2971 domain-containing protein [Bacteroidales bacterium]|jgi:hypothetical protein